MVCLGFEPTLSLSLSLSFKLKLINAVKVWRRPVKPTLQLMQNQLLKKSFTLAAVYWVSHGAL